MMEEKTLQAEVEELTAIHNMIETAVFQKFLAKPMKEERDKLRRILSCFLFRMYRRYSSYPSSFP